MRNLTTRKIVLGLLMMLVLVFGVQGTVDAVTISTFTASPADLSWTNIGGSITVTITISANLANTAESVTFSVSNGATFDLSDPAGARSSHTWSETGPATDVFESTIANSSAGIPSTVTVTVPNAGEVTATLSATGAPTEYLTFYVVKHPFNVVPTDTVSLINVTRGVGGRYSGNVKIHSGDGRNNPVTYEVTGTGATLYIQKGNDTNRQLTPLASPGTNGQTSSNADVWLAMAPDTSSTVTASVTNSGTETEAVYIHGNPTLTVTTVPTPTFSGPPGSVNQGGTANDITVTVTDQNAKGTPGSAVLDVPVKFDVVDKTTGGYLIPSSKADSNGFSTTIVDINNNPIMHTAVPAATRTVYVRTSGATPEASVGFQFGTIPGTSEVTVSIFGRNVNVTETVEATVTGEGTTTLTIDSNRRRSGNSKIFDLVAHVERGGANLRGATVLFRTSFGVLTNTPTGTTFTDTMDADLDTNIADTIDDTGAAQTASVVNEITDHLGLAQVTYDIGDNTGRQEIDAIIYDSMPNSRRVVTFVVNGPASPQDQQGPAVPANTITLSPSSTSGAPGEEITLTVSNPAGITVNLSSPDSALSQSSFDPATGTTTTFTSDVTLPSTPGEYQIDAEGTIGGQTISDSVTLTVERPGTLTAVQEGTGQIHVTASPAPSSNLAFTLTTSGGLRVGSGEILTAGWGRAIPTGLATTGSHVLTVSAVGYNSTQVTFTPGTAPATDQQPGDTSQPTPTGQAGEAERIEIDGSRSRDGILAEAMRLRVRVLDANDNGVSDVAVTFTVLAPGGGTFAGARGSGRAIRVDTDRNGYASTNFTPTTEGDVIVRAGAAGVPIRVTFIIDVAESTDDDDAPTPDTDAPPRTTIDPEVHVGAANRPPMLWVDGGGIYALVGADVEKFAPSVDNAMNITVAGDKVYWTEQTGESSGTINSANLDGSGAKELKSIMAVPMGIAVDTDASKLYWTNSRGRIQSMNADGGRVENVLQDLSGPMDIAVARGNLYWTQYDATAGAGSVGIANPTAQTAPRSISTGADAPMNLTIANGKVYWTERTGTSSGTINSANLNGNGAAELASILAVPSGIAVDGARSKLYWTNSRGRIQSANLDGSRIQNVVDGLGNPGDMVLSNSISAPAAGDTASGSGTTASNQYDINGDGSVDGKDVDAIIVAVAADVTDDKYDVNGDGKVDIMDVVAVSANRDNGAAGAPALVGNLNLSVVQIDRLQEQINLLIATGDRSPAAMRTLIYLQQLIATARPEQTQLFANFPNPFNPETWIPYELATDTDVRITIYSAQGVVIRTLQLGQQSAGYYTDRERAAYWDGRNAFGEQVASGVYFYQLETDTMSALRKMVILK